ncbi:hypothetical protein [Pyrobaculum sp.]|uniref:hypothetical protein n=1 Tax=Pyrobaculum sp. TaxID=2004705 RepID=UPI003D097A93
MITTSAVSALEEICNEIGEFGEPANPALGEMLRKAYQVLDVGGAVAGHYGQGKSLVATLTALLKNLAGTPSVVLKANQVVFSKKKAKLSEVSNLAELEKALKCMHYKRWFDGLGWVRERGLKLGEAAGLQDVDVPIEGEGLEKLRNAVAALRERGYHVVVDEFERLVEQPQSYGFRDLSHLVEEFFNLVDRWGNAAGIAIPTSLWVHFDIQIKSRIAPIYYLQQDVTPSAMKIFLERKVGRVGEPLASVEFRNPRAVMRIVAEIKAGRAPEEVVKARAQHLKNIAYMYRASVKTKEALYVAYLAAWLKQNIYATLTEVDIHKALELGKTLTGTEAVTSEPQVVELLVERRRPLMRRAPGGYVLTASAITHLRDALVGEEPQQRLMTQSGEDYFYLAIELFLV